MDLATIPETLFAERNNFLGQFSGTGPNYYVLHARKTIIVLICISYEIVGTQILHDFSLPLLTHTVHTTIVSLNHIGMTSQKPQPHLRQLWLSSRVVVYIRHSNGAVHWSARGFSKLSRSGYLEI